MRHPKCGELNSNNIQIAAGSDGTSAKERLQNSVPCSVIRIERLDKSFGKLDVLRGIDLDLAQPGITAVLGPNASGKTTLIKCILGMVIPDGGSIYINGDKIDGRWAYRDKISYLPQIARFPENLRVREMLDMVQSLRNRVSRADELIVHFGLEKTMDQRLHHLSGGTRQKINIVMTFMYDNPLIILDEPSAGLDPVALIKVKDLILAEQAKGKQILITTHIMGLVEELADTILFLLDGRVHFEGSLGELRGHYGEESIERCIAKLLEENGRKPKPGSHA